MVPSTASTARGSLTGRIISTGLLLLAACTPVEQNISGTEASDDGAVGMSGVVSRATDGDTLEIVTAGGSITVRLAAVNAPEQGECFADVGLDFLIDAVEGREVVLEIVGIDQFDRSLAHVFGAGRHINMELVTRGMAIATTPGPDDRVGGAVVNAEESAYTSGRGLWAGDACGRSDPLPRIGIVAGASTPNPAGPDDEVLGSETLTIANDGEVAVDLSGWTVRDESSRHRYSFSVGTIVGPGERMTVSSDDPGWSPGGGPVWNNDGDMALVQDELGTVVSRWRY